MESAQSTDAVARLSVRNVGGIDETTVSFEPGVTVLAGRNATNRTSLLQAVMAGLGSENVSLKGDADEGSVEIAIGDETYTRTLERGPGGVTVRGEPYLDDPEVADLFAFLLESNEARRAVQRGDDLRELIMRPVDTAAIESEIDRLEEERRRVEAELDELSSLDQRLPELEERRTALTEQIEEKAATLEETETDIENADRDVEATRAEKRELDRKLESLRDARSDLENARFSIESERDSIDALESEVEELEAELETLPAAPSGEAREVEGRISELRERKRAVDSTVNELQTVVQFNEEMLEGGGGEVAGALHDGEGSEDGSVTDRLVEEDGVVCWTCGSDVDRSQIRGTLDRLRELRRRKLEERRDVESQIDELETEKLTYEEKQRQRDQLERRIERTRDELERRERRLESVREERAELEERVEALEDEVESLQDETHSELLDLHKEANRLEFELGRLESDRDDVEAEIEEVESRLDRREELTERREGIQSELDDLRTRIDDIEREAVEQFNSHIETVLGILEYGNLERVWIERKHTTRREGRRRVETTEFDLHIVRSAGDGTTYEDTIDHLSESEREVVGIVFALAGYLVHEVHEVVPFMLLDSLEAIDSERIADLIDYVADYADYTVVALLPEDAGAVDDSHPRVSRI
jgi:DNA repair exonuclease SbcCD ATPase subunit